MRFFELLHKNATASSLGLARVVVFSIWFVHVLSKPIERGTQLPASYFDYYGILRLFEGTEIYYSYSLWLVLRMVTLACLLVTILGIRPYPFFAFLSCVLITWFDGTSKGFQNYINHAESASLYAAYVLALFPAADGFTVFKKRIRLNSSKLYSIGLSAIPFFVCITYTFIAARRLSIGSYKIFLDDSIVTWVATRPFMPTHTSATMGLWFAEYPILAILLKMGFLVTTLCELLSPLYLICPLFRKPWLVVMVSFHILTMLAMDIYFIENLILIFLLMTRFPHWVSDRLANKIDESIIKA